MFYKDYSHWIREQFPFRVQKISVDAAFSCPNRDGRLSLGGCTFCDNKTFNPSYCDRGKSITQQLEEGKAFFAKKYPEMKYLAYFQAYSNTYAPLEELKRKYEEALAVDDVVGLVIGTRPDCVSDEALDYLQQLNQRTFLIVEYGIESANDNTLRRINRGHTFDCSRQGTPLAKEYEAHPFHVFSAEEYVNLVIRYVSQLRNDLVLERFVSQSPPNMVIAPKWGLKNHEFTDLLNKRIRELGYDHR